MHYVIDTKFIALFSHDLKILSSSLETYYQPCFPDCFVWEEETDRGVWERREEKEFGVPSLGLSPDRDKRTATRCTEHQKSAELAVCAQQELWGYASAFNRK